MKVKDFINKNKSLLQKIGIGLISLVIVIMICLSPNIIKNLKGNVSSINPSEEAVDTGVELISDTIYDENTTELNYHINNNSGKKINLNYDWTLYGSQTIGELGTEIDTNTSDNGSIPISGVTNYKQLTIRIKYDLYTFDENKDDKNIYYIDAVSYNSNALNSIKNVSDESKEFIIKYKKDDSENFKMKITNTKIYMDLSEDLKDTKDVNVNFLYSSAFGKGGDAYSVTAYAPQSDESAKSIYGENLNPTLSTYFTYSNYSNSANIPYSSDGSYTLADEHLLWGKPNGTTTNGFVDVYVPVFSVYKKTKKNMINQTVEDYSRNTYQNDWFSGMDEVTIAFNIYDKSKLLDAIKNANNKISDLTKDYNKNSVSKLYDLVIKRALPLYMTRDVYTYEGNSIEVNQSEINKVADLLNNYELTYDYADLSKYESILNDVSIAYAKQEWYEQNEDYTNFINLYNEKDNFKNATISHQDEVDNYVQSLSDAFAKLIMLDADYSNLNSVLNKAKSIKNIANEDDELYTSDSWKKLQDAIKTCEQVVNDNLKINKQDEVDNCTINISEKIEELKKNPARYTEINNIIASYQESQEYKNDYWTYESKNAVDEFIKTKPENKYIDSQKEIDDWKTKLEVLINELKLKNAKGYFDADNYHPTDLPNSLSIEGYLNYFKTEIAKKINGKNLYTDDTITKINNVINDYYDKNGNWKDDLVYIKIDKQSEMDKLIKDIDNIKNNSFVKNPAKYDDVNKAIERYNSLDKSYYMDLSSLETVLNNAKSALSLKLDEQSIVDEAAKKLNDAIDNLSANYSKINDFKTNVYDKLDSTKYTNFDILVNAMNNIDYSIKINEQEKVNEMYNSLVKVYNNLIKTRADYSKVELAINNAKKYEANKYNYTNYDEVEKLINSIDYNLDWGSQDKVDKYATDINYAISNLNKKLADYSKLAKVLSKLPADYSKYSSDIQKEIKEYLDEVKDLSTDLRYDEQDVIDEIVKRGNILLDKLSKIKDYDDSIKEDIKNDKKTTTTKKVTTIKKNSTRKNSSNKSKTTVKTADSSKNNNEKVIKYIKINDEKIEFTDNKINLNVDFSVEKADVVVKLQNDEDKYEVYGGEVLMPGINTVTIIVTRKNGTTYRYDINIKRPETSNYLSSVEIKNSSIKFDKNKNNYTINVDKDTNKLDLIAELEDKNATMKITGNSNLKNGSKVEIKVTDTKGNTNTYVITIKKSDARYIKIIIIIVALLSALTVGYKLVQNKKRN